MNYELICQIILGTALILGGILYAYRAVKNYYKSAQELSQLNECDHSTQWRNALYEEISKKYNDKIKQS